MKIYVTKKDPSEFVRSGFESLTIWFGSKPVFDKGYCTDNAFGLMTIDFKDFRHPRWTQNNCSKSDSMKGKCFSRITGDSNPVWKYIWESLKDTYVFDKNEDLYMPVHKRYEAKYKHYLYHKKGRARQLSVGSNLNLALKFIAARAADIAASKTVEREGCRWWEWCLEIEVSDFALENNKTN